MFREQNEADCHGGDWFPGDLLVENAPDNARFHRPLVFHQHRKRRVTLPGDPFAYPDWTSKLVSDRSSLEELLVQKLGASGPGIAVAARALEKHNEAHIFTLEIEEKILPLQQALIDPVKARVLSLSEEAIKQQLSRLLILRDESLLVVQTTDEALVEFGLDYRHFRRHASQKIEEYLYGDYWQRRTVLEDSNPPTASHHKIDQKNRSFLSRLFIR